MVDRELHPVKAVDAGDERVAVVLLPHQVLDPAQGGRVFSFRLGGHSAGSRGRLGRVEVSGVG